MERLAALKMVTVLKMIALTPENCWKTMTARHKMNGCQTCFVFSSVKKGRGGLEGLGGIGRLISGLLGWLVCWKTKQNFIKTILRFYFYYLGC